MKNLLWELQALNDSDRYPFHMPGHKRNLANVLGQEGVYGCKNGTKSNSPENILVQAAGLDITEIDGFDNLHAPEGILKEALDRAAALYGADETLYSVNGSTAGLLTAISAAVPEGSKVLTARNCHKAVYHAIYLRRLKPVYLYPDVIGEISIADALKPEDIRRAMAENPDAAAVILTSPTYDGICADVAAIADIVHAYNAVLIVDAAHGAHFGFHPDFPESPVRSGADLTVVSLHKTLPAMTQTALLHVKGNRVDRERVRMFSGMYQTSSPSYFFMAGMDACMRLIEEKGASLWDAFWHDRAYFLHKTEKLQSLRVFACSRRMDAGKILIETGKTGLTGQQLYDILLEKYHLQMEMAAGNYVTAIVTCCDSREGWERLAEALTRIDAEYGSRSLGNGDGIQTARRPYPELERRMPLTEALDQNKEWCPLCEAKGRIAGGFINLYPPGIPLAVPGEVLSGEVIGLIQSYFREGLPLQGLSEGCAAVIK